MNRTEHELGVVYSLKSFDPETFIIDAPNWAGLPNQDTLQLGLTKGSINARSERGQRFLLGQLYGVVNPGLILAKHVFKGLKRDMRVGGDAVAASCKLAITWDAKRDAVLDDGRDRGNPTLSFLPAPPERVFVVYISPNRMLEKFPSIYGWIEHWAWLGADPTLSGAPVEWETRYDEQLWTSPARG
jgi:hypothetical protein